MEQVVITLATKMKNKKRKKNQIAEEVSNISEYKLIQTIEYD